MCWSWALRIFVIVALDRGLLLLFLIGDGFVFVFAGVNFVMIFMFYFRCLNTPFQYWGNDVVGNFEMEEAWGRVGGWWPVVVFST